MNGLYAINSRPRELYLLSRYTLDEGCVGSLVDLTSLVSLRRVRQIALITADYHSGRGVSATRQIFASFHSSTVLCYLVIGLPQQECKSSLNRC